MVQVIKINHAYYTNDNSHATPLQDVRGCRILQKSLYQATLLRSICFKVIHPIMFIRVSRLHFTGGEFTASASTKAVHGPFY
jgi:hypothetical protein